MGVDLLFLSYISRTLLSNNDVGLVDETEKTKSITFEMKDFGVAYSVRDLEIDLLMYLVYLKKHILIVFLNDSICITIHLERLLLFGETISSSLSVLKMRLRKNHETNSLFWKFKVCNKHTGRFQSKKRVGTLEGIQKEY